MKTIKILTQIIFRFQTANREVLKGRNNTPENVVVLNGTLPLFSGAPKCIIVNFVWCSKCLPNWQKCSKGVAKILIVFQNVINVFFTPRVHLERSSVRNFCDPKKTSNYLNSRAKTPPPSFV